jgi:hypothetical protein
MRENGLEGDWQWELVFEGDGVSVAHRCWGTGAYGPLDLDAATGVLRCRRCNAALAVRREDDALA